ncbi:MAG: hypothetical protein ABSD78_11815 [Acidimicrobiales bacterium]
MGLVALTQEVGGDVLVTWEQLVKKGRHRRFEEARSLKRAFEPKLEPCPECGHMPDTPHASWCLYESEELEDEEEESRPTDPAY